MVTAPTILGVDPGGKNVGIALRHGYDLLDWRLVTRPTGMDIVRWCADVITSLAAITVDNDPWQVIAIEDVVEPTPHMGLSNVRGILDTATILGAVTVWAQDDPDTDIVLVDPAKHGRQGVEYGHAGLVAAYPRALVGPREQNGRGKMKDVRAAWDIAEAARRKIDRGEA